MSASWALDNDDDNEVYDDDDGDDINDDDDDRKKERGGGVSSDMETITHAQISGNACPGRFSHSLSPFTNTNIQIQYKYITK